MLDESDKSALLGLARSTLESYFKQGAASEIQTDLPGLKERKGAFVSLHNRGELRGCIGQLDPGGELHKVVQYCTLSAAFDDSRFMPLRQEELADLTIEISVLTPFRRIEDTNDIIVGKHGLYIVQGFYRGLLLPQVAEQYGWDRLKFLEQTCHKAGLPASAWRNPQPEIFIFEAEVFSEPAIAASGLPH